MRGWGGGVKVIDMFVQKAETRRWEATGEALPREGEGGGGGGTQQ